MKTLCDYSKKDIEKQHKRIAALIKDPKYICEKCARSANDKKALCKATKIKGE
jgi:hypothetical protein